VNREQDRRAPAVMRALIAAYRCPDCDSESGEPYPDHERGIWRAEIRHDETCPWYRQHIVGTDSPKAAP
jgi:hypothetical protein